MTPSIELMAVDVFTVAISLLASFSLAGLSRRWLLSIVAGLYGAALGWIVQIALLHVVAPDPLAYAMLRLLNAGDWLPSVGALAGVVLARCKQASASHRATASPRPVERKPGLQADRQSRAWLFPTGVLGVSGVVLCSSMVIVSMR